MRPQSPESIAAQLLREHKGQHVGLLAPLVVNRKGVYTDLAKWAKARGHSHLRVDGRVPEGRPLAAARPLQGAHARAAGGRHRRQRRQRGRTARPAGPHAGARQGRDAPAGAAGRPARGDGPARTDARHRHAEGVLDQARLPELRHQLPRARPAHVQLQQQARLVHHLRGHRAGADARAAQGLRRFDQGRRQQGPRAELSVRGDGGRGRGRRTLPRLPRHPAEPGVARRDLRRPLDRLGGAVVGQRGAAVGGGADSCTAARPRSRATSSPRSGAASSSWRRWASAT